MRKGVSLKKDKRGKVKRKKRRFRLKKKEGCKGGEYEQGLTEARNE